jgi:hypothetical protein
MFLADTKENNPFSGGFKITMQRFLLSNQRKKLIITLFVLVVGFWLFSSFLFANSDAETTDKYGNDKEIKVDNEQEAGE